MEGNRDEAEKCIGIAREALEAGNRDRALRFLGKAQKLYPTETARGEARPRARRPVGPAAAAAPPPLSRMSAALLRRDETGPREGGRGGVSSPRGGR